MPRKGGLLDEYLLSLAGRSASTVETYRRELAQLLHWIGQRPGSNRRFRADQLTATALETYLAELGTKGHSISHRARVKSAVGGFARWLTVFHGQRGELRQRYREGQEDQLGALGLVLNALILWNTRYMDAALSHLRARGKVIKPEDEARLSPLGNKHFNVLGQYHFHVTDSILKGELRPLRSPENLTDFEDFIP